MESIEKLREKIRLDINNPWSDLKVDLLVMCDKIEREIAERYMELPVDVQGVPVKLGDTIGEVDNCEFYTFTVVGYTSALPDGIGELLLVDEHDDCWYPKNCIHVKQRTIEDVLEEFLIEFDDWDWNTGGNDRDNARKQLFAKYADELRSMGVGE